MVTTKGDIMTQENLRTCLNVLSSKIPSDALVIVKQKLQHADDRIAGEILDAKYHDPIVILIVSFFVGSLGVDRFLLGDTALGICKLLFNWLTLGLWYLCDLFVCFGKAKKLNLKTVMEILARNNLD